jgi:CRISPR/Cas system CSM-associated protein Csm3 (group 7 of RAMP superfamily)
MLSLVLAIFTQYPITQISPSDTIRISAVATVSQIGFNGSGTLGTIQFVAKKIGQTKIEIVYQENQTTETNLVELQSGQEILQLVKGATIDIK